MDHESTRTEPEVSRAATAARARLRLSIGAGIVLVIVAAGIAVLVASVTPQGVTTSAAPPAIVHSVKPQADDAPTALVHVVGAVRRPGIYELPAGDRILDAVSAAGGFVPAADQSELNLAQVVTDGEQITVVKKGAVQSAAGGAPGGKVDINTADLTALQTLDGIGPALAQRILDYRKAHGGFSAVSDLQNVSGIGDKKFAAIKDHVTT
ncbi:MAG TPA: helix-hairpin-helix domain-containing protein [Galbitalea sp.]